MFPAVITALAFIITFIVVGLVVVAAAFSGGRRQSERPPGPTRRSRRFVGIGVGLVVVVLGVLVPALVIASAKDSKTAPGGVKLTTSEERGRNIFAERCATCHTLAAAKSTGKVGPDLDKLPADAQKAGKPLEDYTRESIVSPNAYIVPGFNANVMPATFSSLPKDQLDSLVSFLVKSSQKGS